MFDPAPRVVYGPEDAERWMAEWYEAACQDSTPCLYDENPLLLRQAAQLPGMHGEFWRPSQDDIRRFERRLSFALQQAYSDNPHDQPRPLREYAVQYIGYMRGDHPVVYARGLQCGDAGDCELGADWPIVFDGGTSVFHATFDPETGELWGPGFNGYA